MRSLLFALIYSGKYFRSRGTRAKKVFFLLNKFFHFVSAMRAEKLLSSLPDGSPLHIPVDQGFLRVPAGTLDTKAVEKEVRELVTSMDMLELSNKERKKEYLIKIPIASLLNKDSSLEQLATNPAIVKTVGEYLGVLPVINTIQLWYSPVNRGEENASSQFFHLDHEDVRQVKLYLAIEPIETESGPTHILPSRDSSVVATKLDYRTSSEEKVLSDEKVYAIASKENVVKLTAEAGDIWLLDTSNCFHYGGRQGTKPRLILMIHYISPYAMVLPVVKYKKNNFEHILNYPSTDYRSVIFSSQHFNIQ